MQKKRRFWNMYVTTSVSITLVLFLVGLVAMVTLSAHRMIEQVKQNVTLTVILTQDADSAQIERCSLVLNAAPYCHECRYISKEDALEEHIRSLGDDPSQFLGYNPLLASYEVNLSAEYANPDSIAAVEAQISRLPYVKQVMYQKDLIELLEHNVSQVTLVLVGLAAMLLLIAYVLIINTIRLHVYSHRFLINTMRLVGATPWVIKRPFVGRSLRMGLWSALLAMVLLAGLFYYVQYTMHIMLMPPTYMNIAIIAGVVLVTGELLTLIGSLIAVNRYIRMDTERMYAI
ncbi:MAG: permease-like cell division protein FtsX [Paludibacteraceae bacterium]|nr:permease-like cell division protein FtsX [Paludibacteraceae bacterium]